MLKNYVKIALRNLLKNRVYSIINILGLTIGIASCLLIIRYVEHELSYDKFQPAADRTYKIALERKYPNHQTNYAVIPNSYADVIPRDYPEVETLIKIGGPFQDTDVSYDEGGERKLFEEDFVMLADSNFFSFFSYKLVKGDPEKALATVNDIVLTERTAARYFNNTDPLGKTLRLFGNDYQVTGVCENAPENSHMKFDFVARWNDDFFGGDAHSNFTTFTAHVYLRLKTGSDFRALEAKFPKMVDTYASSQIEQELGKSWNDYKKEGNGYRYFLQPLARIHLDPIAMEAKITPGGNIHYIYFLVTVAALILVIACINFMNLATARSAERAREVGLRKAMGSLRRQLIIQFLVESVFLSVVSTALAIALAQAVLPLFNDLASQQLTFSYSVNVIAGLIGVGLFVGVLAGSYPAFALSSFNTISVMKGNLTATKRGSWLRSSLVVFQFFISIILIVGTLIIRDQMEYMQNKSLGFDKEKVLVIERTNVLEQQAQAFINELNNIPNIDNAASAFALLGREGDFFGSQFRPDGASEILTTKSMVIDDDFASTLGFEFVAGRGYSKETNDSLAIILNESAVKTLELTDPIGKKLLQTERTAEGTQTVQYTIIGVIKDFNFQSLRDHITPLTVRSSDGFGTGPYAYVKMKGANFTETMTSIEALWKKMAPDAPFRYVFLDQNLNAQYDAEIRAGKIFGVFSSLAILIGCVGLFGLAAYTSSLRTKEIGVRKVLGASVSSIVVLLTSDLIRVIGISFLLAIPLAWYLMDNWLAGFAYHVDIGVDAFLIAGFSTAGIAWLTVSYQSVKAAIVNPVKSLRSQ